MAEMVGDDDNLPNSSLLGATSDSDSSASVTSVEYLSTAASILRISALLSVVPFSGIGEFALRPSPMQASLLGVGFTLSMGKDLTCFSGAGGIVVFGIGGGKGSVPGPDDACAIVAAV